MLESVSNPANTHTAHLLADQDVGKFKAYPIRWWLLLLASCIAGGQGGIWLLYGVTAEAVKPIYSGWTNQTIALLALWGPLTFMVAAWPTSWLLDVGGLRATACITSLCIFLGSLARVAAPPGYEEVGAVLAHVGQLLNGLAGPVAMSIGPKLSAVWFPPAERNAATAIAATANYGGTAIFFALGSLCVPASDDLAATSTRLWHLNVAIATFAALLLAACLLSFPSKPPRAPSRSATTVRESPLGGIRLLARNRTYRTFWALAASWAIQSGCFQGWGSFLGPNMQQVLPAEEAETQAGIIGTLGAIVGMAGGIGVGCVADRWQASPGRRQSLLVSCLALGGVCFAGFALACSDAGSGLSHALRLAIMYGTSVSASLLINAATPLYFELAVEATYPIAEGLTMSTLNLLQAIPMTVFTAIPLFLSSDAPLSWMNWVVIGACALGALLVAPLEEPRRRLAVDAADLCGPAGRGSDAASAAAAVLPAVVVRE